MIESFFQMLVGLTFSFTIATLNPETQLIWLRIFML